MIYENVAVLIPSYQPSDILLNITEELCHYFKYIYIINDGSNNQEAQSIFDKLDEPNKAHVLHHFTNLGKGAALKTGLNYICTTNKNIAGIVTVDADGQHSTEDVVKVAKSLLENPEQLILGSRTFSGDVPIRSKLGNLITAKLLSFLTGINLQDSQTGLRGLTPKMIAEVLQIKANGYEFETEMLLKCKSFAKGFKEVPIKTIYTEGNASSHFNPIFDSMRIYFLILRFFFSSILSTVFDYALFAAFYTFTQNLAFAQGMARSLAWPVNFYLNRDFVFKSNQNFFSGLAKYLTLVAINGYIAYLLIEFLHRKSSLPIFLCKGIVEIPLFFANYAIQKEFVFRDRRQT